MCEYNHKTPTAPQVDGSVAIQPAPFSARPREGKPSYDALLVFLQSVFIRTPEWVLRILATTYNLAHTVLAPVVHESNWLPGGCSLYVMVVGVALTMRVLQ